MLDLAPGPMLAGAQSLLMLCFGAAALYFSWILSRAMPAPVTRVFFGATATAMVLKVMWFVVFLLTNVFAFTFDHPLGWQILPVVGVTLSFLERLAWLVAALALLRWALVRKGARKRKRS